MAASKKRKPHKKARVFHDIPKPIGRKLGEYILTPCRKRDLRPPSLWTRSWSNHDTNTESNLLADQAIGDEEAMEILCRKWIRDPAFRAEVFLDRIIKTYYPEDITEEDIVEALQQIRARQASRKPVIRVTIPPPPPKVSLWDRFINWGRSGKLIRT